MAHLQSVLVAVPAAGALLLAALPGARRGFVCAVTGAAAGLAVLLALPLWLSFEPRGAQWQFVRQMDVAGWRAIAGVDGFAVVLVVVTAITGLVAAVLLTREAFPGLRARAIALLLMETGVLGALVSLDLLQMFAFWQLAVVALILMTMLSGARRAAIAGVALVVVGAAGMLSGLLALGEHYRSLAAVASFDIRAFQTMPVRRPVQMQAFVLLALGCLTPLALLALHAWCFARSAATQRGTGGRGEYGALLASMMLAPLALFGFLRVVMPVVPQATRAFATAMVITGGASAAIAVVAAAISRGRVAVAWIALAQVSLAMVGLFAATPDSLTGAALLIVAAGLALTALVPVAASLSGGESRIDAALGVVALVAVAAASGGARLLVSGLAPLGGAAVYGMLAVAVACGLVLASLGLRRSPGATGAGQPRAVDLTVAVPSVGLLLALAVYPAPLLARIETSVARLIVRVSPEYASQVADCLNQPAPPPPAGSGLPAGMMLAAPCTDPSGTADPAVKR